MKVRPFGNDDFAAVAALLAEDERSQGRTAHVGVNEIHEWTMLADLANDSWLYEDDEGPVAVGWVYLWGEVGVGVGVVHPRAKGRGLGGELLERSDSALRARDGVERIHQFTIGSDTAARELLESRGYTDARHFFDMAIELSERPDAPEQQDGGQAGRDQRGCRLRQTAVGEAAHQPIEGIVKGEGRGGER